MKGGDGKNGQKQTVDDKSGKIPWELQARKGRRTSGGEGRKKTRNGDRSVTVGKTGKEKHCQPTSVGKEEKRVSGGRIPMMVGGVK